LTLPRQLNTVGGDNSVREKRHERGSHFPSRRVRRRRGDSCIGRVRQPGARAIRAKDIHGAWVGGWYWRRVSDLLEKNGHKAFSPTLTGLGERSHLLNKDVNLDTHVTDIVNVIKWENLDNVCLVAHSYGGFPGSGALEKIGGNVSSIVWLDASKPRDGQKGSDWTSEAGRKMVAASFEKGDAGFGPPKLGTVFVNEKDSAWVNSKVTAQPTGTFEKAPKKTYVRLRKYPNPNFDNALAECKSDALF
jgi:Alpha/beta hydrolase family